MEQYVQLPPEVKAVIFIVITIIVTAALKKVSTWLKRDLTGYTAQVTSALVATAMVVINAMLSHIPADSAAIVNGLFNLVVILLGSWGGYKFIKQLRS